MSEQDVRTQLRNLIIGLLKSLFPTHHGYSKELLEELVNSLIPVVSAPRNQIIEAAQKIYGRYVKHTIISWLQPESMHPDFLRILLRTAHIEGFETPELMFGEAKLHQVGQAGEPLSLPKLIQIAILRVMPSEKIDEHLARRGYHRIIVDVLFKCPNCEQDNYIFFRYEVGWNDLFSYSEQPCRCSRHHAFYVQQNLGALDPVTP